MSLKDWRKRQKITQAELAKRLGCSRATVSNNEHKLTHRFMGLFAMTYPDDIREIIEVEGTGARHDNEQQAQSGSDV
jgi:transcriptional regulator with XRE-family HTH domain